MQACAVVPSSLRPVALRPVASSQRLAAPCRLPQRRSVCRASEEGNAPASEQQQQAAPPPPQAPQPPQPPMINETAPWDRQPRQLDMQAQPDALGPVGNFFMAVLLIVLCAGSFWSTVGRQFQADLVPLTPEQMAEMQ